MENNLNVHIDKSVASGNDINVLLTDIRSVLSTAKTQIVRHVNTTLINAYWLVGKYIVEFEQGGKDRAEYNKGVIRYLAQNLTKEFGNGYTEANLRYMRLFYKRFPICHALRDKLGKGHTLSGQSEKCHAVRDESQKSDAVCHQFQNYDALCHNSQKGHTVRDQLTWTHYRALLKVQDDAALEYYMNECIACNWSTRQLERQIHTLYYERLLASRDKESVRREANTPKPDEAFNPREIIRDPYILEFIGISQGDHFLETDLEQMLITRLQKFLLELGRGFTFVARQKRISFDNKHYYIDLVFYNILTRSYVLIDLKTTELTHEDLGQMQMYVNYYTRELMNPGDNPPIGIVLCAEKCDQMVQYTLPEGQTQVFAAKYMTYMPSAEELRMLLDSDY